jgi:hypothetical protein
VCVWHEEDCRAAYSSKGKFALRSVRLLETDDAVLGVEVTALEALTSSSGIELKHSSGLPSADATRYSANLEAHIWRRYWDLDRRLKVGLLVRSCESIRHWMLSVIQLLMGESAVELAGLFHLSDMQERDSKPSLLFQLLFDRNPATEVPFGKVEIPTSLLRRAWMSLDTVNGELSLQSRSRIEKDQLDVLVWLDDEPLSGSAENLARLGVWSFCLGDPGKPLLTPPYWREVVDQDPVSVLVLQRHTKNFGEAQLIHRYVAATCPGPNLSRNAAQALRIAPAILIRSLLDALEDEDCFLNRLSGPVETAHRTSLRYPSTKELLRFMPARITRSLWSRLSRKPVRKERWFLAIRRRAEGRTFSSEQFQELPKPCGDHHADPFVIEWQDRHWLLFEEVPEGSDKGRLVAVEILNNLNLGDPAIIFDQPYHTSYPLVFQHNGDVFLLPETAEAEQVQLYRATRFPHEWELHSVLADGVSVADTTPILKDGIWYFFTTSAYLGTETFLFYSYDLCGPWRYHPANPICSDVRTARGAGRVFWRDGRLIRPAQDCSVRYGHSIVLNEVIRLSTTEYEEHPLEVILPDWQPGLISTHTLNFDSMFEVIDGARVES